MVSATTVKGDKLRSYYAGDDLDFSGQKLSPQVVGSGKKMFGFHRLTGPHSLLFEELLAEREVKALDLTISAPKSLSILFALGDQKLREMALSAHQEANLSVLNYIEHQGLFRCAKKERGQVYGLPAMGMLTLPIPHFVNRNFDPQVHSHNLIGNIGMIAGEDQVRAVDFRVFFSQLKHLDRVYKTALRAHLEGAGIATYTTEHGVEIDSITRAQIEVFSTRLKEVDQNLKNRNRTRKEASTAQRQTACLEDRPKKGSATTAQLFERWYEMGVKAGVSLDGIYRESIVVEPAEHDQLLKLLLEQGVTRSLSGIFFPTRLNMVNAVLHHAHQLEDADQAIMQQVARQITVAQITKLMPSVLNKLEVFAVPGQAVQRNDYLQEQLISVPQLRQSVSTGNTGTLEVFMEGYLHAKSPSSWVDEMTSAVKRWRSALYHIEMDRHDLSTEQPPRLSPKKQQERIRQTKQIVREQFHDEIMAAQKQRPATAVMTILEKKTAKIVDDWLECTRLQVVRFTNDPHPSRFANQNKRQHKLDKKFADKIDRLQELPLLPTQIHDVLAELGTLADQIQIADEQQQPEADQLEPGSDNSPELIIENFKEELEDRVGGHNDEEGEKTSHLTL